MRLRETTDKSVRRTATIRAAFVRLISMVNPTYVESTVQSRTSVPKLVRLVHLDLTGSHDIDSGIF
jgi:hypothetical protein